SKLVPSSRLLPGRSIWSAVGTTSADNSCNVGSVQTACLVVTPLPHVQPSGCPFIKTIMTGLSFFCASMMPCKTDARHEIFRYDCSLGLGRTRSRHFAYVADSGGVCNGCFRSA